MRQIVFKHLFATVIFCSSLLFLMGSYGADSFSTGGHTVYQLRMARIQPDENRVLVAAAYDGTVLCLTTEDNLGVNLIWKNQINQALPLDLDVEDLDGDGREEMLLASADGTLYVFDHNGELRWRFECEAPMIQVRALIGKSGRPTILAGGIDKRLYALSPDGDVLKSLEFDYPVRHIRSGDFLGDGHEYAAGITAKNDKGRFFLQLYEPESLKPIWDKPLGLSTSNSTEGTDFYVSWLAYRVAVSSLLPMDIDGDGCDEMLISDYFDKKGEIHAFNAEGRKVLSSSLAPIRNLPYRMNLLTRIDMPDVEEQRILGLYGNQIILYRLDGTIEHVVDGPYSHACTEFDSESNTLFLGSSISGGDGIYALHLDQPGWQEDFENLEPVGRITQVEQNMATLAAQVEQFVRPAYQSAPQPTTVVTGSSAKEISNDFLSSHKYENVHFVQFNLFTEDYDRDFLAAPWDAQRESRHPYNFTAEEIIDFALEREERQEPFALWAGHGNDPFYMRLTTIEGILDAAPTMCKALVFPEMERTDEAMEYAVRTHLIPIAELCRRHGTARVVLRNKNIFWNGSCYLELWREILLGGEYHDVFVPSMEETNGRTQAISLSGRMGLWLNGDFDHLSARAVTDNANFSRFWEWGAQQNLSHLMRSLALRTSLGADICLVNIYQGDARDLATFYQMLDKGVIAPPERDELLSVADLCLGMKSPSQRFLEHGKNGHGISLFDVREEPMVFDRMDCYWGGAPTDPSDFSNYAMGSKNRMLNFLPTNPYGLIASVPEETELSGSGRFREMLITDGEFFYDEQGRPVTAREYKETALEALHESAARLPIRVEGDVAWTVSRIAPSHVRVTLIDSGYLSPADRDARIVLQHVQGTACRDILSGQSIPIIDGTISLTIPAGILRIVDIAVE
jgi:lambda-carrageenase